MPHRWTSISSWPFAGVGVGWSTTWRSALVHVTAFTRPSLGKVAAPMLRFAHPALGLYVVPRRLAATLSLVATLSPLSGQTRDNLLSWQPMALHLHRAERTDL